MGFAGIRTVSGGNESTLLEVRLSALTVKATTDMGVKPAR
jgi:hypothetical protein